MRKLLFLIAGLTLVLAACRAEVNIVVDIGEDGSGEVAFEVGYDEEFRELVASSGGDPDDLLTGGTDFGLEGAEDYERTEGDMTFVGTKQQFSSVTEIEANLTSDPENPFQTFSYVQTDDTAELDALIVVPEEDLGVGDVPIDPSTITDEFFSFQLIFGMPGTVTESNADEVLPNGQLVWKIPITGGEKQILARSEVSGGGSLWWIWLIVGVVLLIGFVALIGAVIASRNQSQRAIQAAGESDAQVAATAATSAQDATTTERAEDEGPSAGDAAPTDDASPADEASSGDAATDGQDAEPDGPPA
jgi:hypothetical protein